MPLINTNIRSISLFLEGLSRATLIPYAPFLIGLALFHGNGNGNALLVGGLFTVDSTSGVIVQNATSTASVVSTGATVSTRTGETAATAATAAALLTNAGAGSSPATSDTLSLDLSQWSSISFYVSIMVTTYIIGRNIGYTIIGNYSKLTHYFYDTGASNYHVIKNSNNQHKHENDKFNQKYATIVGSILALQFFSFGIGYNYNLAKIWSIRFLMGILNGFLQRISIIPSSSTSSSTTTVIATTSYYYTGTIAKEWLLGFGLSTLSSGLFYRPIHTSSFDAFFSNSMFSSWSWIVLVLIFACVIFITQIIFQLGIVSITNTTPSSFDYDLMNHNNHDENDDIYNSISYYNDNDNNNLHSPSYSHKNIYNNTTPLTSSLKRRKNINNYNNTNNNHTISQQEDVQLLPQCTNANNRVRLGSHNNNQDHHQSRVRLGSCQSNISDVFFDCDQFDSTLDSSLDLLELGSYQVEIEKDNEPNGTNSNSMVTLGFLTPVSTSQLNYSKRKSKQHQRKGYNLWNTHADSITKYENGKCMFDDGTPSHVPAGCSYNRIPTSFQKFYTAQAHNKWEETKKWRKENKLYKIHRIPHRLFPRFKEAYPHYIHGHSKMGYPVIYEQPAKMKLKDLFREGVDVDEMVHHYKFFLEYLSNVLSFQHPKIQELLRNRPEEEKNSDWGFVIVMDVSGISLSAFSGAVLQYLQKAGAVNNSHYPNTTQLALLINAPFWLSGAFGKIKHIIPKSTKADLIGSRETVEGLRKYIDDDQIPKEFNGSSPYALDEHPYEIELHSLVEKSLEYEEEEDSHQDSDEEVDEEVCNDDNATGTSSILGTRNNNNNDGDHYDLEAGHDFQHSEVTKASSHSPVPLSPQHTVTFVDERYNTRPTSPSKSSSMQYSEVECTFFNVSFIYWLLCGIQGSIEVALPLWLLSPSIVGGLVYQPFQSGICFFASSFFLYVLLRSYQLKKVSRVPIKSPLKGLRVGMGLAAALLVLMPLVPQSIKNQDMVAFSFHIIICGSVFVAIMIGRSSTAKIHYIVSCSYHDNLSLSCDSRTRLGSIINLVCNFIQNGGLTWLLGTSGEIFGALLSSPIIAWSYTNGKSYPCDATFIFHAGASLCVVLYIISFTIKINGESMLCRDHKRTLCSFIQLIISVSATDLKTILINLSGRHPEERSKRRL